MNHRMLCNWSLAVGAVGLLCLFSAFLASVSENSVLILGERQWYGGGIALMLVAIWMKLGAIYHKSM